MNIVLDSNVKLDADCRNQLQKLLRKGETPSVLDESTGKLKGTFKDMESSVFINRIPVDVMKYHGDFFRNHNTVPQWFFIVLGSNSHGVALLKKAEINYDLNNCRYYYAPSAPQMLSTIDEIADDNLCVSGKVLIFFKHKKENGNTAIQLARYLFGDDKEKYEIAYESIDPKSGAGALLICGDEERDFKMITVPETMKPIFVITHPEKYLQQYLHPEQLIELLAASFDMTTERVRTRLYFVSVAAQDWFEKRNIGNNALENGLLIWDRFGLPVSRNNYYSENIESFLSKGYFDGDKLRNQMVQNGSADVIR